MVCWFYMWRHGGALWKRCVWTPLVFIPVLGPLIYGGFYSPPDVQPEVLQGKVGVGHNLDG